jgi:hypothetical protein
MIPADDYRNKNGRAVYAHLARFTVHDTPAPNETVRIHVEHPEHAGCVHSWLRYSIDSARKSIRNHIESGLETEIIEVEVLDFDDLGITAEQVAPDHVHPVTAKTDSRVGGEGRA